MQETSPSASRGVVPSSWMCSMPRSDVRGEHRWKMARNAGHFVCRKEGLLKCDLPTNRRRSASWRSSSLKTHGFQREVRLTADSLLSCTGDQMFSRPLPKQASDLEMLF